MYDIVKAVILTSKILKTWVTLLSLKNLIGTTSTENSTCITMIVLCLTTVHFNAFFPATLTCQKRDSNHWGKRG